MKNLFNRLVYVCAVLLMVSPLVSCGGGGGGGAGTGTLDLGLTDDPGDYKNVFVTIKEITVKQKTEGEDEEEDSGWLPAITVGETFDLLTLQNDVIAELGEVELEAGEYRLRLILETLKPESHPHANYLVIEGEGEGNDEIKKLNLSSQDETGLKIPGYFEIAAKDSTRVVLDFNANDSIVQNDKQEWWRLKPTVKILETENNAVVGLVDPAGAKLSAQIFDPDADPLNQINISGSTTSNENGDYVIFLPPNTYNIVATNANFLPKCQVVDATPGYYDHPAEKFVLDTADAVGTLIGSVAADGLTTAESALFSIRQENVDCGGMIELASFSVYEGTTSLPITLPTGTDYQVVVSATGEETQVINNVVVEEDPPAPDLPTPTEIVVFTTEP